MATFTIALKDVLTSTSDIGLNEYPIFDEAYRVGLNKKIIDHYHNQEIGQETVDMFIFAMKRKMNEIMPFYNQMYTSQLLEIDPLLTFRSTSHGTGSGTADGTSTNTGAATNSSGSDSASTALNSNYPQTALTETEQYADTGASSTSNSTATGSADTVDNSANTNAQTSMSQNDTSGFSGSMSQLLLQYRETFVNLDLAVIGELSTLFMLLWDNGDQFSQGYGFYPYFTRGGF